MKKEQPKVSSAYSGFQSNQQRFSQNLKDVTPGPGQYQQKALAKDLQTKISSKIGVFGTTQKRFIPETKQEQLPGPGQYQELSPSRVGVRGKTSQDQRNIKKCNSMFLNNPSRLSNRNLKANQISNHP
mmetsp:Transcript_17064/g.28817  ORF Transcript_17064/g.28817 Transcript_17064/m.28817 type:complete len:128 (+) Transcript_17064:625-1008(+)